MMMVMIFPMVLLIVLASILYQVPTRTGQKDNYSIGVGFSATWSRPLDKKLQEQCKEAALLTSHDATTNC